jgi:peroxiredoxin
MRMKISKYIYALVLLLFAAVSLQAQNADTAGRQQIPSSADAVEPLEAGRKMPSVKLKTPEGAAFDLNAFVQKQPVVLIFYRGGWCPYCNVHLQELMEADPQLRTLGYQILAVSPDKPQKLAESQEKHHLTYQLLSDPAMQAAKAFGVAFQVDEKTAKKYKETRIALPEGSAENQYLLPVLLFLSLIRKL